MYGRRSHVRSVYEIYLKQLHRRRSDSFGLDFLNFRRCNEIFGWRFNALALLKDHIVVYKLWSGQPVIREVEDAVNPSARFRVQVNWYFADPIASDATIATYDRLLDLPRSLLAAGYAVIVGATFLKQHDRYLFCKLPGELSVPFAIVDVYAPAFELRRRIVQRSGHGLDASEATLAVLGRQLLHREPITVNASACVFRLDSTRRTQWSESLAAWKPLIESLGLHNRH